MLERPWQTHIFVASRDRRAHNLKCPKDVCFRRQVSRLQPWYGDQPQLPQKLSMVITYLPSYQLTWNLTFGGFCKTMLLFWDPFSGSMLIGGRVPDDGNEHPRGEAYIEGCSYYTLGVHSLGNHPIAPISR